MRPEVLLPWGKTDRDNPQSYHPLLYHMLDASAVALALRRRFGPIEDLPPVWIAYLVGLHDIGKADPRFQMQAPELCSPLQTLGLAFPVERYNGRFPHEAVSGIWARDHLRGGHGWGRESANVVGQALCGHHGVFGLSVEDPWDPECWDSWEPLRCQLANALYTALGLSPYTLDDFADASASGVRLAGLIVLADWIASNDQLFLYRALADQAQDDIPNYFTGARQEAEEAIARLDLDAASVAASAPSRFEQVWPMCVPPRPSQAALETAILQGVAPGLAIIEAPMGEGKTEGAVYLAEDWNRQSGHAGCYIALPTMATSNQMHGRYKRFLAERHADGPAPRLIHGMAWLLDDDAPESSPNTEGDMDERMSAGEWFRNSKRALLAPEGVGTVDQALRAVLHVKHGFLRLFGLSPRTLIIDEVHAYDEYMTVLLEYLLQWCSALRIPVILLSATLSRRQKQRLVTAYTGVDGQPDGPDQLEPYPLLTFARQGEAARTVEVEAPAEKRIGLACYPGLLKDPEATARLALGLIKGGGCACVLANTVGDAQCIFRHLQGMADPDTRLLLFHARYRAERRGEIEDEVVALFGPDAGPNTEPARPKRAILVATQVVEQSLNVDFDVMISQIAPIDLLLQRAGRMHRHDRGERPTGLLPVLHVLLPEEGSLDFGGTGRVYGRKGAVHAPLLRTLVLLEERHEIVLPRDFRPLIEACYGDRPVPTGTVPEGALVQATKDWQEDIGRASQQARTHLVPPPSPRVFTLPERSQPVDEGEPGDRESYFLAQTRRPDDGYQTVTVMVLQDPGLVAAARGDKPPRRDVLKRLLLQQVDLPDFWTRGAERGNDLVDGAKWLRGRMVMSMKDTVCRLAKANGKRVVIRDDQALGLVLEEEEG